jgi:hypothetical protein
VEVAVWQLRDFGRMTTRGLGSNRADDREAKEVLIVDPGSVLSSQSGVSTSSRLYTAAKFLDLLPPEEPLLSILALKAPHHH